MLCVVMFQEEEELASYTSAQGAVLVYRVQVTPTRIKALWPKTEVSNRVLREFASEAPGSLLRVAFSDDDLRAAAPSPTRCWRSSSGALLVTRGGGWTWHGT